MKERGAKVLKEKKKQKKKGQDDKKDKPKGLYTRESEAQLMLQAMAFNEKVIKLVHVVLSVIFGRYFGMISQKFGMKIYYYLLFELVN